ncbi:MAG: hypothetical protein AAF500_19110 [Myxococcota bacterium]
MQSRSGPLFAVVVQFAESSGAAVALLDDLDADQEIDLGSALLIPGNGDAFGSPFESDVIFAWSGDAPRLTRYRVGADGSFTSEGTLALDGMVLGAPNGFWHRDFMVVSREKAYVLDGVSGSLISWNPSTMRPGERLTLPPDTEIPGPRLGPVVGADRFVTDDRLVFTAGFTNSLADDISSTSFIVFANTADDELERLLAPDQCGYLQHGRMTAAGDFLFSSGVRTTGYEVASEGRVGGPSCVLRVDGEDFSVERIAPPGALTDGRNAGGFIFVSDTSAFVRVLDDSAVPGGDPSRLTRVELTAGEFWRWGFIRDLDTRDFEFVADSELGLAAAQTAQVGDRMVSIVYSADLQGSQVSELRPDGTIVPGVFTTLNIRNIIPLDIP